MVHVRKGGQQWLNNTFAVAFKYLLRDGTWNGMKSLRQQSGQTIGQEPLDSVRWLSKVKIKYHKTHEEVKIYVLAKGECQNFDQIWTNWSLQLLSPARVVMVGQCKANGFWIGGSSQVDLHVTYYIETERCPGFLLDAFICGLCQKQSLLCLRQHDASWK